MELKFILLVLITCLCIIFTTADAASCESGWTPYKDEICIKIFDNLLSYEDAKIYCGALDGATSTSTLVMVKESALQEFLVTHTQHIYESIWLGSKYDNVSAAYKWDDGEPLSYTNWAEGYPRNITDAEVCIQLRPIRASHNGDLEAKWEDAVCQKRGLVMCQQSPTWTLKDAVQEIIKLRKQVNEQVAPIGSIYIEYFDQPSPVDLWPTLQWQDITDSYAGLFFRAHGGDSEAWGKTQPACSPRISHMQYEHWVAEPPANPLVIPRSGWSAKGQVGVFDSTGQGVEKIQFHTEDCEVRPQNQAIRLWKRVG